jgi:hypothetical protein
VQEDIMDWVPSERAKYAGLGIVVLNTGVLAALSMLTALGKIISAPGFALVPVALAWGWIIFSIDRWLITSTHGVTGTSRVRVFLPRLALAAILAFAIAEPLTLRIFQNTLDTTVNSARSAQLAEYESLLKKCNPVSGQWVGSPACAGNYLTMADPPDAVLRKQAAAQQQAAQLQGVVTTDQAHEEQLLAIARAECAGTSGVGLTGHVGMGPRCKADTADAANYVTQSGLDAAQAQLEQLRQSITGMNSQVSVAQTAYATEVHTAIDKKLAEKRADLGQIGIIDEWAALEQLSNQSTFVSVGHWVLFLFLIALDSLPVLAKLMSGTSAYDKRLAAQLARDSRVHEVNLRRSELTATEDKEIEIEMIEMRKRDRIRTGKNEERIRAALVDNDGLDHVRALVAERVKAGQEAGSFR